MNRKMTVLGALFCVMMLSAGIGSSLNTEVWSDGEGRDPIDSPEFYYVVAYDDDANLNELLYKLENGSTDVNVSRDLNAQIIDMAVPNKSRFMYVATGAGLFKLYKKNLSTYETISQVPVEVTLNSSWVFLGLSGSGNWEARNRSDITNVTETAQYSYSTDLQDIQYANGLLYTITESGPVHVSYASNGSTKWSDTTLFQSGYAIIPYKNLVYVAGRTSNDNDYLHILYKSNGTVKDKIPEPYTTVREMFAWNNNIFLLDSHDDQITKIPVDDTLNRTDITLPSGITSMPHFGISTSTIIWGNEIDHEIFWFNQSTTNQIDSSANTNLNRFGMIFYPYDYDTQTTNGGGGGGGTPENVEENRSLQLNVPELIKPNQSAKYTVTYVNNSTVTNVTASATVVSNNTSVITVNQTTHTLHANASVNTSVNITANYTTSDGFTLNDTKKVVVAELTVENLPILPPNYRPNAALSDSSIFFILLVVMVGVLASMFVGPTGAIGAMQLAMVIGWYGGYVGIGITMVSLFVGLFIGLNTALNVDYAVG